MWSPLAHPCGFKQGEVNECLWLSMFLVKLIAHVGKLSENVHFLAHIPAERSQVELLATDKITLHLERVPTESTVFTTWCLVNIWLNSFHLSNFSYMNLHCIITSQSWVGSWFPIAACHRTFGLWSCHRLLSVHSLYP